MKKLKTVLLAAFTALALAVPAFADIAIDPVPQPTGNNAPLIAALVLVAVVAVVLIAVFIKRKRGRAK